MPDNQLGRDAAQISYQDLEVGSTIKDPSHSSLNGYKVDKMFGTTGDGLTAYALRDPGTGNVVIAFRGTSDGEDWKDNVGNLGWRQWQEAKPDVERYLKNNWKDGAEVTFAGHSLGGALAQYAAYEAAGDYAGRRDTMNLVTLNGLGAVNGIDENLPGGFDASRITGVETANFYNEEDRVPRLGGGHVGDTYNVGSFREGNDGILTAHSADSFDNKVLNGAKDGSPDYYKNATTQMDPETLTEMSSTLGDILWNGPEGLSTEQWVELAENVLKLPDLKKELPETKRLVTDIIGGVVDEGVNRVTDKVTDLKEWGKEKYADARDWAYDLTNDITDLGKRGLDMAEQALKEGWDSVTQKWDEGTKWTKNKVNEVKDAIDQAKDTALDWLSERRDEFEDWANKGIDGIEDWVSEKTDKIGEVADWVKDQGTEFSNSVRDKWQEMKTKAGELTDDALDWLKDKGNDVIDFGKEKFDEGRQWVEDTYDKLKDEFRDKTSDLGDWAKDKLNELAQKGKDLKDKIGSLWDNFNDWLDGDDENNDPYADDVKDRSTTARTEASPLVLDLDGDGLELASVNSKGAVYWDIDTDGIRELTGWVRPDDGLLAIDSNQNGEIDDHSELFGTETVDGFTSLAVLDSNSDGVIDRKDDAFADLLVWRDLNQDGNSDPGELQDLDDAGVRSINLSSTAGTEEIAGNRVTHISTYTGTDGRTREISDVWFTYDNVNSRAGGNLPFDPDSYGLPQLRGYGQLADLRTAMSQDAKLQKLVAEVAGLNAGQVFGADVDILDKMQTILFRWAGVENIDPASRGTYVDARQVGFVEVFTDRPFLQHGRPNPAPEAGRTLTNAFETALYEMLTRVLVQTVGERLFKGSPEYDWQSDSFTSPLKLDMSGLGTLARNYQNKGADMAFVWTELVRLIDTAVGIDDLTKKMAKKLDKLVANTNGGTGITVDKVLDTIYPAKGLGLNGTSGDDNLRGGGGRDSLSTGNGDDTLVGLRGDDNLNAGEGNDVLNGGPGNDLMQGGNGNDTYIYSSGFDTIVDTSGEDLLKIQARLNLSDLAFLKSQDNGEDLEIYASGELIVRIEDFYLGTGAVETLELRDGTIFDLERQAQGIVGTGRADRLKGDVSDFILSDRIVGKGGNDVLQGLKGADVLEGQAGNDKLSGGLGDDVLIGGAGRDTLIGGPGTDISQGGTGNDTYRPAGSETIIEEGGKDTVVMRKGMKPGDVTLFRTALSNDLTIETGKDRLLVKDHFTADGAIEMLKFKFGGKTVTREVSALPIETRGTEANDYLRGDDGGIAQKDVLRGLGGIDRLYGYGEDDVLDGGADDDYLYGSDGDDTLIGGAGNDSSYGGTGGDTYLAGPGDDFVQDYGADGDKDDRIVLPKGVLKSDVTIERLLDGDLLLSWTGGSMRVDRAYDARYIIEKLEFGDGKTVSLPAQKVRTIGTEGNDTIYGNREEAGSRNDDLNGLAGNDTLYGYDGNDVLDGGAGDDHLYGAEGKDLYKVGEGDDYISDLAASDLSDGKDTIKLAAGILPRDVTYTRLSDGDLVITWGTGSVRINNAFDARYAVETLEFANGTTVDLTTLTAPTIGTNGGETLYGNREEFGGRNDTLRGLDGDDRLYGYDGKDVLDGGKGDDQLYGEVGADTYKIGEGDDFISDAGASDLSDGKDKIELAAGIRPGDVTYTRLTDGDLMIDWGSGSVRIDAAFDQRYAVELLKFANGTTVDLTKLSAPTIGTNGRETLYGNREEFGSRDDDLRGLDGNDTLYGYDGDDMLDGGDGDDTLYGEVGADLYKVGQGDDYISDVGASDLSDGPDTVRLAAGIKPGDVSYIRLPDGDLLIDWGTGSVRINSAFDQRYAVETLRFANGTTVDLTQQTAPTVGTNGRETLYGNREEHGSRDDDIRALDGDDTLYGYDGDDTLDGGKGDDTMYGEVGADTYKVGEGDDYISDVGASDLSDGKDIIELAAGIAPGDVSYSRLPDGDLLIDWGTGSVRINNAFDQRYAVETLKFANGTTVDLTALSVPTIGTNGRETVSGNREEHGSRDDDLRALDGDDTLNGYDGNDRLDGGKGDDKMYGGEGGDTYVVGEGDDYILDYGVAGDPEDVLRFVSGIAASDLSYFLVDNSDLLVTWDGGSVLVDYWTTQTRQIEKARLSDGTVIDLVTVAKTAISTVRGTSVTGDDTDNNLTGGDGDDTLYGYGGNDTLDGGKGDDDLYGAAGKDTYVVGEGDDYVSDTGTAADGADVIKLAAGITAAQVSFQRELDGDLTILWNDGSVRINAAFDERYAVETLRYDSGATVDLTTLQVATLGTGGNDNIYGNREDLGSRDDTLKGFDGDDTLYGYDGDDTLDGGKGDDDMYGADGKDTYLVGEGDDYISDAGAVGDGPDVIKLAAGITPADVSFRRELDGDLTASWSGGSVRINNAFDERYAVEKLRYADGTVVDLTTLAVDTLGTGGDDSVYGNREELGRRNDTLIGLDGDDTLYGYDGNDTLDGGKGDDDMYGAEGKDTYLVGEGDDYISDAGADGDGPDVIKLAAGIRPADVSYMRELDGDLSILWDGGSVRINSAFDQRYAVETLRFANGTKVDLTKLELATIGTGGGESISGNREEFGGRNDALNGLDGDDTLYGYDGNDTLDGGKGDDDMYGADGKDTYLVGEGDDFISDAGAEGDGPDVIKLAAGIRPAQVSYMRELDGDLSISWDGGSVRINGAFDQRYAVETLRFANGTKVDLTTLQVATLGTGGNDSLYGNREEFGSRDDTLKGLDGTDYLYGYDGDDRLDGGLGDDFVFGSLGNDTYVASKGTDVFDDGRSSSQDSILFNSVNSVDDLEITRSGSYDMSIAWAGGTVILKNQYYSAEYQFEKIIFGDGSEMLINI